MELSAMEKDKPVKEYRECWFMGEEVAILYRVVRESYFKDLWGTYTSQIKGPVSREPKGGREQAMQTAGGTISRQTE